MSEWIASADRTTQEKRGTIRTFTGKYVNPLYLKVEDIEIRDVAHHLSIEPRYAGSTKVAYSVAQHSVMVASYFRASSWDLRLAALLHDASEYVLKDLPSPVKANESLGDVYRGYESDAMDTIFKAFGLNPYPMFHSRLKVVDDIVFDRERRTFFGSRISPELAVRALPAPVVERMFLDEYRSIYSQKQIEAPDSPNGPAFVRLGFA
jgi:hypothetical protein